MKWLFSLLCFTTITAFSQTNKPLLEKLKKTQEQLRGKLPDAIPNQALGLNEKVQRPSIIDGQKKRQLAITNPNAERLAPGRIPNATWRFQNKPRILDANEQSMVITLSQDNMPCLVPNMEFWKVMPNAGNKAMLQRPIDPGIYLQKPKS